MKCKSMCVKNTDLYYLPYVFKYFIKNLQNKLYNIICCIIGILRYQPNTRVDNRPTFDRTVI